MQLTIRNFRGVESATIEINKLTLIGGGNFQGKTSIAQAAGAVLTGNAVPLPDVKKKDARLFLRDGQKTGSVELKDGETTGKINYPGGTYSGNLHNISKESAGFCSLLDMKPVDRLREVTEILKAEPTKEQFIAAMQAAGFKKDFDFDRVWAVIDQYGWEQAYQRAKEAGARLKGGWETITGEHYGSQKAESWTPEGLTEGTEEELKSAAEAANKAHQDAISSQAVSTANEDAKKNAAEALEPLKKEHASLQGQIKPLLEKMEIAKKAMSELPKRPGDSLQTCPWCSNAIAFDSNGFVTKAKMLTREAKEAVEKKRADITAQIDTLSREITHMNGMLARTAQSIAINEDIVKRPAQSAAATVDTTETQAALEKARFAITAFQAKQEADAKHTLIGQNAIIQDQLKPEGLRKAVMLERLSVLNQALVDISTAAAWIPVSIEQDMSVKYGTRPLAFCSASEQFFSRIALQMAIAKHLGHRIIVVDGVDIVLNKPQRNGIFKAIMGSGMLALVCMSFASKEEMPDLGKVGGNGYWVQDGRVT